MDIERGVVSVTALVIIALAVATGPLGLVDPSTEEMATPETGNATIAVGDIPETATLDAGQHGTDLFVLRIPDTTIEVSRLRGNPILDYSLKIQGIGFKGTSVYFLDGQGEGPLTLSFDRETLDPGRIDQDSYEATLSLTLRGERERVVFEHPVTIEVKR